MLGPKPVGLARAVWDGCSCYFWPFLQAGGEECGPHFSTFFSHFPGRSLSLMFKRKHSSSIVL